MINHPYQPPAYGKAGDAKAPVTWQVTSQSEGVSPVPGVGIVSGVRVYFTLSNGMSASVFVPHTDYTVEGVKAAIQERVDLMTGVGGLRGSTTGTGNR